MNDQFNTRAGAAAAKVKPAELDNVRVGIIGLGYVGLPLAVYLARHFPVAGFDIDTAPRSRAGKGVDRTREVTDEEFAAARTHRLYRRHRGARATAISTSSPCRRRSIRPSAPT